MRSLATLRAQAAQVCSIIFFENPTHTVVLFLEISELGHIRLFWAPLASVRNWA
jgi:hypothetical protein